MKLLSLYHSKCIHAILIPSIPFTPTLQPGNVSLEMWHTSERSSNATWIIFHWLSANNLRVTLTLRWQKWDRFANWAYEKEKRGGGGGRPGEEKRLGRAREVRSHTSYPIRSLTFSPILSDNCIYPPSLLSLSTLPILSSSSFHVSYKFSVYHFPSFPPCMWEE